MKHILSAIDNSGCGNYRLLQPVNCCIRDHGYHPDDFKLHIGSVFRWINRDDVETVTFQRRMAAHLRDCKAAQELGKLTVFETDDFDIALPPSNPLWKVYQQNGWIGDIKALSNMCEAITVSTPNLYDEYRTLFPQKPIEVIPNTIDLGDMMWNLPKGNRNTDRIVIGWAGSSTHREDLRILSGIFSTLNSKYPDKIMFMMAGFTPKVHRAIQTEEGIKQIVVDATPEDEDSWYGIIKPFSRLYRNIDDIRVLVKDTEVRKSKDKVFEFGEERTIETFTGEPIQNWVLDDYPLQVLSALPFQLFPQVYRYPDIMVAPNIQSRFADSKSNLKVIEAWSYRLPVVASPIRPYRDTITQGENGFIAKNPKQFIKYLSQLIENKDMREEFGNDGREQVEQNWNTTKECTHRFDWYDSLRKGG